MPKQPFCVAMSVRLWTAAQGEASANDAVSVHFLSRHMVQSWRNRTPLGEIRTSRKGTGRVNRGAGRIVRYGRGPLDAISMNQSNQRLNPLASQSSQLAAERNWAVRTIAVS